ncbi:hypothetical protein AB205_0112190 [Aquarana catesbeiana]|uniref:Uncharacterized protein n=1 Tax=Aquarana catesbeiana TaxID=8400 RepID=A0A2G9QKB2_AQUCT|nr:hypothetical protein AB205_0112190 [Aquarana catesbeiana]
MQPLCPLIAASMPINCHYCAHQLLPVCPSIAASVPINCCYLCPLIAASMPINCRYSAHQLLPVCPSIAATVPYQMLPVCIARHLPVSQRVSGSVLHTPRCLLPSSLSVVQSQRLTI